MKPLISKISQDKKISRQDDLPFVSVVIPTYNRSGYVEEAIISALTQDYPRLEVIVVDDGSTDDTRGILLSMKDRRLRYIQKDHTGAPDTRNRGIVEAKGEFILWLDSDDVLMPGVIPAYAEMLSEDPRVDVIYGDLLIIDKEGRVKRELKHRDYGGSGGEILSDLLYANAIPNPGTLVRKSLYQRFGTYDLSFKRTHDYEFWTRIAVRASFRHAQRVVCRWRWHDANMSTGSVETDTSYEARIVKHMVEHYSLKELFPGLDWDNRDQSQVAAYTTLGEVFGKWKDDESAVEYFEKGIAQKKTFQGLVGLAKILYRLKDFDRAKEGFEEALMLNPSSEECRTFMEKLQKSEKAAHEMAHWKTRKEVEGVLANDHYEYFFTRHFSLEKTFFANKNILDIGCGPRGSLEWAKTASVPVGLDPLALSYRGLGTDKHRMAYVAAESESIPFADAGFDLVSSFNSLDHVNALAGTTSEIKRVLKPGGSFLLLTEVNHPPTPTEPMTFSWDVVNHFTDFLELEEVGHYERDESGIYQSIRADIPFDHSNPTDRPGILSAKFMKRDKAGETLSSTQGLSQAVKRKVNILFLSHSPDIGGAERCLLNIFKYLDRDRFRPFAVFSREGPLKGMAESLNVKTFISPIDWWIYPANLKGEPHWDRITSDFFPQVDALVRIIEKERIDLVHTNTSVIWAGAFAAKIAGVPHLWHIHEILDSHPSLQPYHGLSTVYSLMNSFSDKVVVVSKIIEEKLLPGIPAKKIVVIPNGIDLPEFRSPRNPAEKGIRDEIGLEKDGLIVGTVGNIVQEKGYDVLIEAARILRDRMDHVHFVVVGAEGDPQVAERLRDMVAGKGLSGSFHFIGYRNDVPAILEEIDLYVNTSLTEASPLSVMEAMAAAKPVVASRCGGMGDVVVDGATGYLVDPGDPTLLAEAIQRLLTSRKNMEAFGGAGRERAQKYFDVRQQVSLLKDQYLELSGDVTTKRPNTQDSVLRILSDVFCSIEKRFSLQWEQWERRFSLQQEQWEKTFSLQQKELSDLRYFVDGIRRTRIYRLYRWLRDFRRSIRTRN
jgi:glycosyltransferase involved in cell wall biosynthesis